MVIDSVSVMFLISLLLWITVLLLLIFILVNVRRSKRRNHRLDVLDIKSNKEAKGCKKVALLIDADNTQCKYMDKIIDYIGQVCNAAIVYRCLYGVESSQKSWDKVAKQNSIEQKTLENYIERKNSTDFSIVIDCMDLLLNEDIDVFVLCSSDSDFSGIANRIRQEGKTVVGMGNDSTPGVFRKACNYFFYLDDKDTSPADLKRVLGELVAHYNGRVSYGKIKQLITNRFGLNMMGFSSFDQVLNTYGYYADESGKIVEYNKKTKRKD